MPILWILLLLGATTAVIAYAQAGSKGPTGKVWPGGITTTNAERAVQIALARETDPLKLRAFAAVIERHDRSLQASLLNRARQLDMVAQGTLGPFMPGQTGPVRTS